MNSTYVSIAIFLFVYIVISARQTRILNLNSASVVLVGSVLMVLFGIMTLEEAFRSIDPNTIILLLGTMIFSAYLERTKFFEFTSLLLIRIANTPT